MPKKIVICSTSAPELNGYPTGLWLEELATPYYAFLNKGYNVVIASPRGGPIPLDKGSVTPAFFTDDGKKFMHDAEAVGATSHSVKFDTIDLATVDCLYLPGGHGTGVDFINNTVLTQAIEKMLAADKIVALVCHGVIALCDCKKPDGTPLASGKTLTGFADSEEEAVELTKIVPYLLESKLKEQGSCYEKGGDWTSKVCVDGKLVTGQNPQSSAECAEQVIKMLG